MRAPDDRMKAAPADAASMDAVDRPEADTAQATSTEARDAPVDDSPSAARSDQAEPVLHKQVERYRPWYRRERRAAAGLIVISMGTIGASAGLFAWTASPGSGRTRQVAKPSMDLDAIETDPIPDDLPTERPTALLAADDAIGQPVDRVPPADGAPIVRGVAAAADAYGVIAVWTDRVLWVSRDDGRSFRQELAAPGPLTAVAVGRDGRVHAARHGRIGTLSPAGHTRWHDLGASEVLAIAAAPPHPGDRAAQSPGWLAVLALHDDAQAGAAPLLWLSDDAGESWRSLIAPHHGDAANRLWVSPDGVIDLLTEDSDGSVGESEDPGDIFGAGAWRLRHYRAHTDDYPLALVFAGDAPAPFAMGHDGLRWRLAWDGDRLQLAADHATGAAGPIASPTPSRAGAGVVPVQNWDVRVAASGQHTVAVADARLLDLGRAAPRVITRRVPGRVDALAVDGIGRAVASVGGSALRYSPRHGWRRLFEIPTR